MVIRDDTLQDDAGHGRVARLVRQLARPITGSEGVFWPRTSAASLLLMSAHVAHQGVMAHDSGYGDRLGGAGAVMAEEEDGA
jgi:hypothetical protein